MPAISRFVDGSGLVIAGKIFPFCFITIACGAISGFHTLISSGTTPKLITRESHARSIGYGAMCLESLVAIMAMIAACTLDPGVYLSMNVKGVPTETVAKISALGFPVTVEQMDELAKRAGEKTLFGRTGGATTLAIGMAHIFSKGLGGRGLDLWYHFAIMFEALFILTTIDAGTRVGRYLLQDALGHLWKPLGDTGKIMSNLTASILLVSGWGYFLIQGVRDPLGGINSLWPLFGIANQLLAAIALCLGTTVLLKMQLRKNNGKLAPVLITFIPLLWLIAVTMTAGIEKITDPDPRIGFLAKTRALDTALPFLIHQESIATSSEGKVISKKAINNNRVECFNQRLDAVVCAIFLLLVAMILLICLREWILLIARKRLPQLCEEFPVYLPEDGTLPSRPLGWFAFFALLFGLARELSGEAALVREQEFLKICECTPGEEAGVKQTAYLQMTRRRFTGINRCC